MLFHEARSDSAQTTHTFGPAVTPYKLCRQWGRAVGPYKKSTLHISSTFRIMRFHSAYVPIKPHNVSCRLLSRHLFPAFLTSLLLFHEARSDSAKIKHTFGPAVTPYKLCRQWGRAVRPYKISKLPTLSTFGIMRFHSAYHPVQPQNVCYR